MQPGVTEAIQMEQEVSQWLEALLADSQDQWGAVDSQSLDDTFGWGAMLEVYLQRLGCGGVPVKERSGLSGGLLLTGPQGCGKHTAAAHMMTKLERRGFEMVFLKGADFPDRDFGRYRDRLEALLEHFLEKGQGLCILLEDTEKCPCRRELLRYLGQQLQYYSLSDFSPLFVLLIDSEESGIPAALRSQLLLCRMRLPDAGQRKAFLEAHGMELGKVLSLEAFAQATQGASYAQLEDMISVVCWMVDSRDLNWLEEEDLRQFLAGQMPAQRREDRLEALVSSAQRLVEQLPELLRTVPAPMTMPIMPTEPVMPVVPMEASEDQDQMLRKFEQMPPKHLAEDVFGADAVAEMMAVKV